jgi:hypothetical protein
VGERGAVPLPPGVLSGLSGLSSLSSLSVFEELTLLVHLVLILFKVGLTLGT